MPSCREPSRASWNPWAVMFVIPLIFPKAIAAQTTQSPPSQITTVVWCSARLLILTTGNIGNKELSVLLLGVLPDLIKLFESHVLIEMNQQALIVRQ